MDLGVISVRYARALLKSALAQDIAVHVYNEMQTLLSCYETVPQLRSTVDNPMIDKATKTKVLTTALGGSPTALASKFVQLVLDANRESVLQFIAASYVTLYRANENITEGRLITATSIDEEVVGKLKQLIQHQTKGNVEFKAEVNPDLIGGFILEYDSYRMDASIKTKLNTVLTQLKK